MFNKILMSVLLVVFISACSTTPKDTADSSGSGLSTTSTSTSSDIEPSSGDASILTDLENTTLGGPTIKLGTQEDLIVNVGDRVFFNYNSAELDSDAQELLQDQVAWIKQHNVSVTIEGHCDERGTREYNLALGEKRAQAVKNYLIGMGILPAKVNTLSYGKERPSVVGSNEGAWSQNRRSVTTIN